MTIPLDPALVSIATATQKHWIPCCQKTPIKAPSTTPAKPFNLQTNSLVLQGPMGDCR